MKTQELFDLLEQSNSKALVFEYAGGAFTQPDYHITEVKNLKVEAINCGGGVENWNETVIQLWENPYSTEVGATMSTKKALRILKKVDAERALDRSAEIRFEYGNKRFHTCIQSVQATFQNERALILSLGEVKADCKDKEACGIIVPENATNSGGCAPGSGCC
jgi:hypothetical protein